MKPRPGSALLNLGHTFGHAIEAEQGYGNWLQGSRGGWHPAGVANVAASGSVDPGTIGADPELASGG